MSEYQDLVFRVSCSILNSASLAEDVTQETFVRLLKTETSFENDGHLKGWLITVARNLSIDHLRRNKSSPIDYVDITASNMLLHLMAESAQPDERNQEIDTDHFLWRHVAQLECAEREVIYLRYAEELTVKEIAAIVERPYPTVCSLLFRARKKLRKAINAEQEKRKEGRNRGDPKKGSLREISTANKDAEINSRCSKKNYANN
ncbi:sigma-70 family RNA polymerase sigma factor [Adlercreutzia equolifaciens]|uniref:RNA polymerase sigma factor n=1 Tax=Adlercreutzia equolifaciens TaxID=446660 RepID=UPI0023AFC09B|nr:sigma-70 family RNA polymerase sigma factor [Adlercreutzia equolifaciens]MDE8701945.1 sigma-70 family RNA polymerase sigma factor [Adlercreutzia equolifaciens]